MRAGSAQRVCTVSSFIARNALPHLLFYGPPGTGKTTTILACARQLYTPAEMGVMVLEVSSKRVRGVLTTRSCVSVERQ